MTKQIVIVGGGTAGWITAGVIASQWGPKAGGDVEVTLIESPDISTIGVGEGTWPTMRGTLQKIGIEESEFLSCCSAALKQGTKFVNWTTGKEGDVYYHPFTPPTGYPRFYVTPYWQQHRDEVSFAEAVTPQAKICDLGLAPKDASTPPFAAALNYGYHLDAGLFAALLQRHCTEKLSIVHLRDNVVSIEGSRDEDIQGLVTAENGKIEGDLFIDCTGMASLLLGQHYGIAFVDRSDVLFNDSAMAAQVPYAREDDPVASQTISTAQESGWVWDIGLPSRRGVGYTYSSRHCSDDRARATLLKYLQETGVADAEDTQVRKLSFKSGHRARFWHKNCVAVGMSAGFLEPLEASALVLIELSAAMISDRLPANRAQMSRTSEHFNATFTYRWDRIIDFLKLHYVLSQRDDSPYWRDHREAASIPDQLEDMLDLWKYQYPRYDDFDHVDEVFSAASYQYVLYGMGFETNSHSPLGPGLHEGRRRLQENSNATRELIRRLPVHRSLLGGDDRAK